MTETHDSSHGARLTHEGPASAKPSEANGLGQLPLLGSNQDSPDPESAGALKEYPGSVHLRWVPVQAAGLFDPITPPAPAQGPHSAGPIHGSAQGETARCTAVEFGVLVVSCNRPIPCPYHPERDPSPHRFQGPVL